MCHICRTAGLFLQHVPYPPHCGRIPTFNAQGVSRERSAAIALFRLTFRGTTVKKIVIVVGATLALVTAAGAADLPRRQPVVYQPAPVVGKMPIGKGPIGKSPI